MHIANCMINIQITQPRAVSTFVIFYFLGAHGVACNVELQLTTRRREHLQSPPGLQRKRPRHVCKALADLVFTIITLTFALGVGCFSDLARGPRQEAKTHKIGGHNQGIRGVCIR